MRFFKQPSGYDFEQPLLNKILRIHVSLMYNVRITDPETSNAKRKQWRNIDFYDSKTRKALSLNNWRVKIICKLGT